MTYTKYLAGVLLQGVVADRPAASAGTYWYLADDVAGGTLYHSDGVSVWTQVAAGVSGGGSGTVTDVSSANTSIGVANGTTTPVLTVATLDVLAANGPPAAAVAFNGEKGTGIANGTAASDIAAFGQIPTSLPPDGSAGGDLGGSFPDPTVVALEETGGPTRLALGAIPNGDYLVRSGSTIIGGSPTPGGPPTGSAGGDLAGTYPNPSVAGMTETSGPTDLAIGSIPDGDFLKRSGSSIIGAAVTSGVSSFNTRTGAVVPVSGDYTAAEVGATPADGWVADTNTWVYASGSGGGTATFTIAGVDATGYLTPGTRIKLTQTTVKYFVVVSAAFSTNTTVTVTAGSDYTLANAAISAPYYSYAANPQGWPGWFNFASSPTGFSAFTANTCRFAVNGRAMLIDFLIQGTSNSTSFGWTLPMAINSNAAQLRQLCRGVDNNAVLASPSQIDGSAGSASIEMDKATNASNGWTSSSIKGALGTFFVEI